MRRARGVLAGFLVLLFLGLSFNAYACLVPLFGAADVAMGNGCSDPQEQPVRQICEAFKTLGLQASPELNPAIDSQIFGAEDTVWLSLLFSLTAQSSRAYAHPADGPPKDLLVETTVLRL